MNNFIVSYTVPIMLANIGWRTYIVFICTLALGGLWVIFLLPETRGKSLEECVLLFYCAFVTCSPYPPPSIPLSILTFYAVL
jgi:hypothetical protein